MWFPKPDSPADIVVAGGPAGSTAQWLSGLLTSAAAEEWRDKVGVAGPRDGSAKLATRLLAAEGWVLKTNLDLATEVADPHIDRAGQAVALAAKVTLWAPGKVWAAYRFGGKWYPLSATPELATIRSVASSEGRIASCTELVSLSVDVALRAGIGLDMNPSNFGRPPGRPHLYYLDDEWYPSLTISEIASAIVGRIPEEPALGTDRWRAWGTELHGVLGRLCAGFDQWVDLWGRIETHPLALKYESQRSALLDAMRNAHPEVRRRNQKLAKSRQQGKSASPHRTAVIADVHGNLPALEAVLAACADFSVDSFLFLGDAVGYGPQPAECVQRLAELPQAQFIRGNHDHAIGSGVLKEGMNSLARTCAEWTLEQLGADERQWLLSLPLDVRGPGWVAVHGAPRDPRRFLAYVYELTYEDNLDYMANNGLQLSFCGHTHVPFVYEHTRDVGSRKLGTPSRIGLELNRILLVNPGSVGQPRDGDPRAAFAIWDRRDHSVTLHRTEYPVHATIAASRLAGLPEQTAERLLAGT